MGWPRIRDVSHRNTISARWQPFRTLGSICTHPERPEGRGPLTVRQPAQSKVPTPRRWESRCRTRPAESHPLPRSATTRAPTQTGRNRRSKPGRRSLSTRSRVSSVHPEVRFPISGVNGQGQARWPKSGTPTVPPSLTFGPTGRRSVRSRLGHLDPTPSHIHPGQ